MPELREGEGIEFHPGSNQGLALYTLWPPTFYADAITGELIGFYSDRTDRTVFTDEVGEGPK